ncbi:MAG TPA: tetratricopeptide repeat protein [Bryobacteraceae bacterium]|jgi:Tfp pilus assembly protein PilF|nr:tetratricopeptide repeat protein [Bryobacteraceae bacterium]
MLRENLTALLLLYVRPVAAISRILDHGRLWFAILAAVLVSVALQASDVVTLAMDGMRSNMKAPVVREGFRKMSKQAPLPPDVDKMVKQSEEEAEHPVPVHFGRDAVARFASYDSWGFFSAIWAIVVGFVPGIIALRAATGYGSFGVLMRRDYLSLLMCTLLCWSAVYLVVAIAQGVVSYGSGARASIHVVGVFAAAAIYFLALTAIAIRTSLGTTLGSAIGLTAAGSAAAIVGAGFFGVLGGSLYFLASPFVLFYAWRMLGSEVSSLGDGLRTRQHLRQQMDIATTNPRDADAHYQLGLIYQQRRQYTEAIARFQKAIEIDPTEVEAQFQLGRIANEQGRFDDAIRFLKTAAGLNDKLSSGEVWRELGTAYFGAGQLQEAAAALQKYTERRSYDPEGLYWYGKTLAALGKAIEARDTFGQCIEAVDTMPKHRRAEVRRWKGLAKTELKTVATSR